MLFFALSTLFEFDERVHFSVLRHVCINIFTITCGLRYCETFNISIQTLDPIISAMLSRTTVFHEEYKHHDIYYV
jgi:hypothetical protein